MQLKMPVCNWETIQSRRWMISWFLILILIIMTTIKVARESRMEPDEETILNVRKLSLIITIGALFLVIFFNFTKGKSVRGDNSTTTDWAYFNFDPERQDMGQSSE